MSILHKPETCERCGNAIEPYAPTIRSIYRRFGIVKVCDHCGCSASKIVDYYGKKKSSDIEKLRIYLQSGNASKPKNDRVFSELVNAGYS